MIRAIVDKLVTFVRSAVVRIEYSILRIRLFVAGGQLALLRSDVGLIREQKAERLKSEGEAKAARQLAATPEDKFVKSA